MPSYGAAHWLMLALLVVLVAVCVPLARRIRGTEREARVYRRCGWVLLAWSIGWWGWGGAARELEPGGVAAAALLGCAAAHCRFGTDHAAEVVACAAVLLGSHAEPAGSRDPVAELLRVGPGGVCRLLELSSARAARGDRDRLGLWVSTHVARVLVGLRLGGGVGGRRGGRECGFRRQLWVPRAQAGDRIRPERDAGVALVRADRAAARRGCVGAGNCEIPGKPHTSHQTLPEQSAATIGRPPSVVACRNSEGQAVSRSR